ncbi:Panacea domain-containing protein [Salinarimonas soli]|uniref:DUF4065 domain-containing protein n=1 Tax=Salinarimonas soli TaxID=1638099 RepID=A0A5B2VEB0_9HYPH|nr:type II toxin-antitoxin system antitoxin SocA domain-containing protein [Salinarimonas soli]KAA2236966.1 DUF4065 domain-containing protein [Salinarimonas soli]
MALAAPYDARVVANLILDMAEERGLELTQVSLLKILYFSHGWFLALNDRPLIKQDFEAWKHGPVVKVVRDEFKRFGGGPISSRATRLDLLTGSRIEVPAVVSGSDYDFVQAIFDEYRGYSAWQLSDMTHERGSPWDRIWHSSEPLGRLALRIHNEDIKNHFRLSARRSAPL